jgi:solute carrier family 25 carnitine/acylcarnitine transporter 20/29
MVFLDNEAKNYYINYYIKGGVSGICGVVLSHPIDTIKTHIQSGKPLKTFTPTLINLYKGITAPLLGVGIEKAIVFGTYNYCLREQNMPIWLSGAFSGLTASLIVSPYERIKILKQSNIVVNGGWKHIINPKFLFKGLSATFTRETPGFAIYFSVYENLKYHLHTKSNTQIPLINSFIYGGLSGTIAWIFIYPQDRIKTILQMQMQTANKQSIPTIIKNIYKGDISGNISSKGIGGIKQFYKGFSWAVGRAILLHSGTFCIMELLGGMGCD